MNLEKKKEKTVSLILNNDFNIHHHASIKLIIISNIEYTISNGWKLSLFSYSISITLARKDISIQESICNVRIFIQFQVLYRFDYSLCC